MQTVNHVAVRFGEKKRKHVSGIPFMNTIPGVISELTGVKQFLLREEGRWVMVLPE